MQKSINIRRHYFIQVEAFVIIDCPQVTDQASAVCWLVIYDNLRVTCGGEKTGLRPGVESRIYLIKMIKKLALLPFAAVRQILCSK